MSISSLVSRRVAREELEAVEEKAIPPPKAAAPSLSDAIAVVVSYIPTEIVGFYTVVLGVLTERGVTLTLTTMVAFLVATPPVVWLVYAVKERESGRPIPWRPSTWPLWEMISATVAFAVWSAALPRSALEDVHGFEQDYAALALIGVSLLLPLIGRLAKK